MVFLRIVILNTLSINVMLGTEIQYQVIVLKTAYACIVACLAVYSVLSDYP